jgi:hypothetical protein
MAKKVAASGMGEFGEQYALAEAYGAPLRRYLERGDVPANSWAEAREQAGAAIVEAWWVRYHRETKNKYASREVSIGTWCFIAGFMAAGAMVYFST